MHKQTISITERHKNWLQAQVASGNYSNTSEVIRDMIREREMREQETPEQIKWLRAELKKGLDSGISDTDPADLLAKFKAEMKQEQA